MRTGIIPRILGAAVVITGLAGARVATAQTTLQRLEDDIRAQAGRGVDPAAPAPAPTPPGGPIAPGRQRAYLGAVVDERNDPGRGVRVLVVRPGGPAEQAGLRPQDLIVAAAGARVRQLSDLAAAVERASPGDRLVIEVLRGVRPQTLTVTLGRQPAAARAEPLEAIPPPAAQGAADGATQAIPGVPVGPSLTMPKGSPAAAAPKIPPPPPPGPTNPPPAESAKTEPPRPAELELDLLKARVQELERRVQELEQALKEAKKTNTK
ncbi:MAG: PDZ domain-containing protein [Thermoguttaceae bacterium]|jgi:hypothetical protein